MNENNRKKLHCAVLAMPMLWSVNVSEWCVNKYTKCQSVINLRERERVVCKRVHEVPVRDKSIIKSRGGFRHGQSGQLPRAAKF